MFKATSRLAPYYLLRFYLKIFFSSYKSALDGIYFIALALLTFYIANTTGKFDSHIVASLIYTLTLLGIILTLSDLVGQDRNRGALEFIYLSGINLYWLVITKIVISMATALMLVISSFGFALVIFNIEPMFMVQIFISFLMILPSITVVILFVNIISANYSVRIVQYLLSLPLLIPLIITGVNSADNSAYWHISLGLNMIYLPIFTFFCRQILELAIIER